MIKDFLYEVGAIPMLFLSKDIEALQLIDTIYNSGVDALYINFDESALSVVPEIAKHYPMIVKGMGLIHDEDQALAAIDAGTDYIICDGLSDKVFSMCSKENVLAIPFLTELEEKIPEALDLGIQIVAVPNKADIESLTKNYPEVSYIIFSENEQINGFLSNSKICACITEKMVRMDDAEIGNYSSIITSCQRIIKEVLGYSLKHIGINCEDEAEASKLAQEFSNSFYLNYKLGNSSIFAGSEFELMKTMYLGSKGHIALGVNNVDRAIHNLALKGFTFNMDTLKKDDAGVKVIYLNEEIGGFAIHLIRN